MKILANGLEDVLGCVWLATACLTYARVQRFVPKEESPTGHDLVFSQSEIRDVAQRMCAKTVHQPRISQWANADHPNHTTNYVRAVGAGRRLTNPDECEGIRVLPWELTSFDTPVLGFEGDPGVVRFGELVAWVTEEYPKLVPARDTGQALQVRNSAERRHALPPAPKLEPTETLAEVGAPTVTLQLDGRSYEFRKVPLVFEDHGRRDLFQWDTTRTLAKALQSRQFQAVREQAEKDHADALDQPLGTFLSDLKKAGDSFYREFLNSHGDVEYSTFSIRDGGVLPARGLYLFTVNGTVRYIGRCRDWYGRRINNGYGRIHPRGCYRDGQSTNCRINSLVATNRDVVGFYVHPLADDEEITKLEPLLIAAYAPEWNLRS